MPSSDQKNRTEPTLHRFVDDGRIPNNPSLPLLAYRGVIDEGAADLAEAFEALFAENSWPADWRNGIYPFPHYHSVCHEALGLAAGWAKVRFGGDSGVVLELRPGDAVILPAGTGHQNLGASDDLLVVGAYPSGSSYDLCRGDPGERPRVLRAIAAVPVPETDPVLGRRGGVAQLWR
jgi:uncharacterized protein YjlB